MSYKKNNELIELKIRSLSFYKRKEILEPLFENVGLTIYSNEVTSILCSDIKKADVIAEVLSNTFDNKRNVVLVEKKQHDSLFFEHIKFIKPKKESNSKLLLDNTIKNKKYNAIILYKPLKDSDEQQRIMVETIRNLFKKDQSPNNIKSIVVITDDILEALVLSDRIYTITKSNKIHETQLPDIEKRFDSYEEYMLNVSNARRAIENDLYGESDKNLHFKDKKYLIKVIDAMEKQSMYSTMARIVNRNSAHHILSHVESKTTFENVCKRLLWNHIEVYDLPGVFYALSSVTKMRQKYRDYINARYEFMAQDLFNSPGYNIDFYKGIIQPFIENTILIDNIGKDEGISYDIKICGENPDYSIAESYYDAGSKKSIYNHWKIESKSNLNIRVIYSDALSHEKNVRENEAESPCISNNPCLSNNGKYNDSVELVSLDFQQLPSYKNKENFFYHNEMFCVYSSVPENQSQNVCFNSHEVPFFINFNPKSDFWGERYYSSNDIQITVPGAIGIHCFYSILENHIRNIVKKYPKEGPETKKLDIIIKISDNIDYEGALNHDSNADNVFYNIELFSDTKTLTEENFRDIEKKVKTQYDISKYDDLAKGIADIRINALLLAGQELTPENLKSCIKVENREGILVYKFRLRKPFICAEIHSDLMSDMTEREDKSKGYYVFQNINAYKEFLGNKQCPFKFLIISEADFAKIAESKYRANKIIFKNDAEESEIISIHGLWEKYMQQSGLKNTVLKSNFITNGKDFDEINSCEHPYIKNLRNNQNNIALFERHYEEEKNFPKEKVCFYELLDKSNFDLDLIDREYKLSAGLLSHELVYTAHQRVLIIDERIAGLNQTRLSEKAGRYRNVPSSVHVEDYTLQYHAFQGNIDIVTQINGVDINELASCDYCNLSLDQSNRFVVNIFGVQEFKYDFVIIHRKLISNLKNLFDHGDDAKLVEALKILSDQVYITTGSGSISDLGDIMVNNFKYIPFSIIEKCFTNAVMKVNLVREL